MADHEMTQFKQRVSAPVAGVLSLLLPGLGQIVNGEWQRGVTILVSYLTALGLGLWRVHLLAHLQVGFIAQYQKALYLSPGFIVLLSLGLIALWLWAAVDAYRRAGGARKKETSIYVLIGVIFFVLGWQISEINPPEFFTQLDDAWPAFSQVIWPWQAAFERDRETIQAGAEILVPCDSGPLPDVPTETPGQPYLMADPRCGTLSSLDENNNTVPGSTLHIVGRGFEPHREVQIWWSDPIGNEFRVRQSGQYVTVTSDAHGAFETDIIMPYRLMPPSASGVQIHKVEAKQIAEVGPLKPSEALRLSLEKMAETIFLGMMATVFGIIMAIPLSFLAARNMMSSSPLLVGIYYLTRTVFNIVRSIEPMIWAIIAVVVVGLGPFAGLIALTLHSVAALGKLYSEAIESIDPGPLEAIEATGATKLQVIMFAVVPQVIPPFVSFSIYRWDINVRMSTIIGMVGGGGIGFLLTQYIHLLDYRSAGIAVWFIAITVATLDFISSKIRQKYV